MWCSVEEIDFALQKCPVTCMYNRNGTCQHAEMTETPNREVYLHGVGKLQQATDQAKRIRAYLYTDQYVQHTIGKSLLSITAAECLDLANDETRFLNWPSSSSSRFAAVTAILRLTAKSRK